MSNQELPKPLWDEKRKRWKLKIRRSGKEKSFYSSFPDDKGKDDVYQQAKDWLMLVSANEDSPVSDIMILFLECVELRTSYSNYRMEKSRVDNWINPYIGKIRVKNLTTADAQRILDIAKSQGKSKKTISNIRSTLMSFAKFCRQKHIRDFTFMDLDVPKGARYVGRKIIQPEYLSTIFTNDTTQLYGKEVFDEYIYAYHLLITTGLRPGELFGLEWEDYRDGTLQLKRSINRYKEETKGKNQNAIRTVVLTPIAIHALEKQRKLTGGQKRIFPDRAGETYLKRFKRFCKFHNIPPVSLYEIRHTFVSIAKTLPEGMVKGLVGHSKSFDTFGVYGHELNGENAVISKSLQNIFDVLLDEDRKAEENRQRFLETNKSTG